MLKHKPTTQTQRFVELDLLRGFAIIIMVFLHILWDLDYFGIMPLDKNIYQYNIICPTLFFLLLGMCLAVSYNRKQSNSNTEIHTYLIIRGLKILALGMILTLVSFIYLPERLILFGVLHCIGVSIILCIPFLKLKAYSVVFATIIISTGLIMGLFPMANPTIFPYVIGFHPTEVWRYTIDYFPIFPWFGVSLLGIALGNVLYKDNKRRFRFPDLSRYKPVAMFSWLGKHSLAIYLLHQPIIAGALSLFIIL